MNTLLPLCILCCLVAGSLQVDDFDVDCYADCTTKVDYLSFALGPDGGVYSATQCREMQDYTQCLDGCTGDTLAGSVSSSWKTIINLYCNGGGNSDDSASDADMECLSNCAGGIDYKAFLGQSPEQCREYQKYGQCLKNNCGSSSFIRQSISAVDLYLQYGCNGGSNSSGATLVHSATGAFTILLALVVTVKLHL